MSALWHQLWYHKMWHWKELRDPSPTHSQEFLLENSKGCSVGSWAMGSLFILAPHPACLVCTYYQSLCSLLQTFPVSLFLGREKFPLACSTDAPQLRTQG